MADEILYMLGVIAVGFAVNYTLRALPFLLFSGKNRTLPKGVERIGGVLSPVIIGCLIVYAYSGSAWRTPWPYLAGAATVALQVWKRNPLLSIVAGTVLYMVLLNCCGCATQTVSEIDAAHPELRFANDGIYMGERRLPAGAVVEALEDAEIPKDRAIHIRMDRDMKDMRAPRALMALLARGGYTRSLLVTEEHGESRNKSGNAYAGSERMARRSDIDFFVTGEGVRFGLLRPVGPDEVLKCLKEGQVQHDQLIRLNFSSADGDKARLQRNLEVLEGILRKAGYGNVRRFDVEKRRQPSKVGQVPPSNGGPSAQDGRSGSRRQGAVRYKRAEEE